MATFIVTYDLHRTGQNYECLSEKLKGYGNYCHLQGSVWLIRTSHTAVQIRDYLAGCIDSNDKVLVAELTGEMAWLGHSQVVSNWIKEVA